MLARAVNLEGRLADGTVFIDFPIEELDFTLGQGMRRSICVQRTCIGSCTIRREA
jgi:hypothetical protein